MIDKYDEEIERAAVLNLPEWNYDWRLLKCQYWQESRLNPGAISPAGAQGIAQFMPETWAEWSSKTGYEGVSPFDPVASIYTGAAYMNYMLHKWYWDRPQIDRICLALASYNAGASNLIKAQRAAGNPLLYRDIVATLPDITGRHSKETTRYVRKILGFWLESITAQSGDQP